MKYFHKRNSVVLFALCLLFIVWIGAGVHSAATESTAETAKPKTLDTPVIKSIGSVDYQHIKLSWGAVEGAEGYRVYRKTDGTSWKRLASQEKTTYTDTVKTGVVYYYTVRAYCMDEDGENIILSAYNPGCKATAVAAAPTVKAVSAGWKSIKVRWSEVAGADGYRVYRKTSAGWKGVATYGSTVCTATISDLSFNQSYTFTVRAYTKTESGNVWGKYKTAGATAKTMLATPSLKKVSSTGGGLKITWGTVGGAQGYRIYRKETTSGAAWKRIAQVKGQAISSYVDKTGSNGTAYYYTVRAYRVVNSEYVLSNYVKKGIKGTFTRGIDPDKPMVALTYDDGPSAYTPVILDVLEANNATATFFVVGDRVDGSSKYQSYVKRAYELGCQIGNHTYEHKTLTSLSKSGIQSQISKCDTAVRNVIGIAPTIMRPPGGARNTTVDQTVGKPIILWSIDTLDWKTRNASKTISSVLNNVKDGDIILMHDLYSATGEASKTIIPSLIKKGYQLVTIEELAKYRGGMKNGNRYSSFRP